MVRRRRRRSGGGHAGAGVSRRAPDTGASSGRAARGIDHALLALCAVGLLLTAYLTAVSWFGAHPAYCDVDSSCDLVQSSRWSTFLGVPMALWGFFTYSIFMALVWRLRSRPSAWRALLWLAAVGLAVSWYLSAISVFVIDALCPYCVASFLLMNVLFALVLARRPAQVPEHAWKTALPGPLGVAFLVVFGLQLHFSGVFHAAAGPEDPRLRALAEHLDETGARFYGTYWCPVCQEQKALFAASAERLPYVECTPNGRNGGRALACVERDVSRYPTWIIDGRSHGGVVGVERLARLSGFVD